MRQKKSHTYCDGDISQEKQQVNVWRNKAHCAPSLGIVTHDSSLTYLYSTAEKRFESSVSLSKVLNKDIMEEIGCTDQRFANTDRLSSLVRGMSPDEYYIKIA